MKKLFILIIIFAIALQAQMFSVQSRYAVKANDTNVFIGTITGSQITTGTDNVAIGYHVGQYGLNDDIKNTVVGSMAGQYLNANQCVFVGYLAGQFNTVGSYNVAIGVESGLGTVQGIRGTNNSFIGYKSGRMIRQGVGNTFMGSSAGEKISSGHYNTAVGYEAGAIDSSGSMNVFIGYKAGGNNTTGNRNMFFGDYRGYTSADSMFYIDNTNRDSTASPLMRGNMTSGVNRGVTIDGILTLTPVSTAHRPTAPINGTIYIDATTNTVKVYINGAWYNLDMTAE